MINIVWDCTGVNLPKLNIPAGILMAGYDTGSQGIKWSPLQFADHPNAIHIDQDTGASTFTADVLDVENGAATNAEAAGWYHSSLISYNKANRPGQRHPTIYTSQSNITPLVNRLIADGVTSGPNLWMADWNLTDPQAVAEVVSASGPFPIVGVQFQSPGLYDVSVFSATWLSTVSVKPTPSNPLPKSGIQNEWRFCLKHKGLYYGPEESTSVCAAGGHCEGYSYNYALNWTMP